MVLPQDVPASRGPDARSTTASWDPYDVWLTRVKQPRDRLPQRAAVTALTVDVRADLPPPVTDTKASEPLLLRGAT